MIKTDQWLSLHRDFTDVYLEENIGSQDWSDYGANTIESLLRSERVRNGA